MADAVVLAQAIFFEGEMHSECTVMAYEARQVKYLTNLAKYSRFPSKDETGMRPEIPARLHQRLKLASHDLLFLAIKDVRLGNICIINCTTKHNVEYCAKCIKDRKERSFS